MFARVRERAGKDWLPTPVRAVAQVLLLLQQQQQQQAGKGKDGKNGKGGGDDDDVLREAVSEAFLGSANEGGLEGNVDGFRADGEVWRDFELQAAAAVVYAGLLEGEEMLERAREVLCKVG
jgi:SET and MYND domain-containing protein